MNATMHSEISQKLSTEVWKDASLILSVKRLRKSFGGQIVLDGLNLELRRGEVVLLRGNNGSGKTTLLNILTGNLEPEAGSVHLFTNGKEEVFQFPRSWWKDFNPLDHFLPERVACEGVGRSWQDIRLFGTQSLRDNIAVAVPDQVGERPVSCLFKRATAQESEKQSQLHVNALLQQLGLSGREHSSADMVSLGQAKRVAIARAVQAGAKILFLDEPLSGLDAAGIHEVMGYLKSLATNQNMTLVIIEHALNAPRVLELATTIWTLSEGKVHVEARDSRDCCGLELTQDGIEGWLHELRGPEGSFQEVQLPKGAMLTIVDLQQSGAGEICLELKDVAVRRGNKLVVGEVDQVGHLHGISFKLRKGQIALLRAPNGWGKTTLFEAIAGLIPLTWGTALIKSVDAHKLSPSARAILGITFVRAQDHSFSSLTVRELFRLTGSGTIPDAILAFKDRNVAGLSGGEKQQVTLYSAFQRDQLSVCLLDEPFSALDAKALHEVKGVLRMFASQDKAILIATPSAISRGIDKCKLTGKE